MAWPRRSASRQQEGLTVLIVSRPRDLSDVLDRLRAVSEDLADHAIAVLSEASREGQTKRPAEERTITQARRAVEKAIATLESVQRHEA